MKRRFTILSAAMVLLAFLAFPLGMRGQSDYSTDYTGNITLSTAGGTSASSCNVKINEVNYPGIKAGTGSVAGAMKITVPADTKYLHLHVAAWNNDNVTLTVTPEGYSEDIDLTADSGISGNSPYIFSGDPSTEDFYKVITFATALAEETELTFTATSGKRFVVWGVTSEEGGTDPYISISGDGIAGNAVTLDYNDENVYTATVTYSNMEEPEATDVAIGLYADAACETGFDDTWFVADFVTGSVTSIEYMAEANTSMDPRTVYMRVDNLFEEEWAPCNVIAITQLGVPTYTVTYMANGGTGFMDDEDSPYFENDVVILLANEFTAPEGMMWDSWEVKGEDGEDIEVIDGMFEMPAKNVIVTAQWVEDPDAPQYEWVLTDIADLTPDDIFVIVGTRGGTYAGSYAMSNDNGFDAAPSAVAVTIANDKLTEVPAENLRWNITGDNTYGYTFYKNGSIIEWLFCTDANNGLRVGGGEDDDPESYFTISEEGYLFSMEHERYVGIYTNQDWRSYTTINNNISGQTFGFYKRQEKSTDPAVFAENVNIACDVLSGAVIYTLENPVEGGELTAEITDGNESNWLTLGEVGDQVPFTCTANDGAERTATVTLTYTYNMSDSKTASVTITQGAADYAILPFAFDGGKNDLAIGLTGNDLGSDYNASPKLKFDDSNDCLILKLAEAPTSLSYTIKGNGTSNEGGIFTVQTSADGTDYEDLVAYVTTTLNNKTQTFTHIDLASEVRYIKWVYTNKSNGNVALGNIKASTDYDIYASVTTENLTIPATKTCTVYSGAVLNVTASLVNEGTAANLIIEDGAQLKHNDGDVQVTMKKIIEPYTAVNVADKYYFIGLPFEANPVEVTNMLSGNYDLYAFESWSDIEWVNYKEDPENGGQFWLHAVQGYLYANDTETELVFTGEVGPALDVPYYGNYEAESEAMFNGWSLAGNPFACNAYLNDASSEEMAFYRMNEDGDGFITATGAIKPLEGIFVMATAPDQTFNFSATQNSSSRSSYLNIDLSKADRSANVVDRAIVRFSEGNMLEKFSFNENTSKLYISQGTKDYAVVRSEAQGEMPVSFKAAENGTYTLSFTNEEVTFDYLHLIDNMTGADVDLLMTPNYTFNASTSDYVLRFRLVFSANSVFEGQDNVNFAYFNGSEWVVNGEGTMQVIDMMGRVISSETINGSANLNVNATPGVYMIRIVNGDNVKVQKIVVR